MKNWFITLTIFAFSSATIQTSLYADGHEEDESEKTIELDAFNVIEDDDRRGYQSNLIIGANRMVVAIDDLATSAFVINSEFIEDLNPRYLTDATKYVAGVENSRYYDVIDSIVIRSNEVGTTLSDGFPVPGLAYVPMSLIEQVEVIKGPQGVLYGQINAGGFFNRVMKKPEFERSGEFRFDVGTYGHFGGMLDTTGKLFENKDNLAYRFTSSMSSGGARQDNLQTDRPENVYSGGLKLAFANGGHITFMTDYVDRETSFADMVTFGDPVTGLPNWARHRKHAVYSSLRTWSENLRISSIIEKKLGPVDTRVSYQFNDHHWADDALFPWGVGQLLPTAARYRDNWHENHNFFIDGVWQPELGAIDNIINFGFSYDHSDKTDLQIVNFALDANDYPAHSLDDPPIPLFFDHYSSRNNKNRDAQTYSNFYSFYGNWRATFGDGKFNVIGGARYQNYEAGGKNLLNDTDAPLKDDDIMLYRGGFVFNLTEGVNFWTSYGETFNVSSTVAPTREGESILFLPDPGAQNIEGGVKVAFWDRRLNVTGTYYALTQTGRTKSGSSSLIPIVAVEDATNKGMELQVTAEPVSGLLLVASLTDQEIRTASGARDTDMAETIANFWAKYTIPEGQLSGLGIGFGVVHYGDKKPGGIPGIGQFGSENKQTDYMIPAVTTLDFTISLDRGPWRFSFVGRNITDKVYMNRSSGPFGAYWISNGRTMTWTSSYRW